MHIYRIPRGSSPQIVPFLPIRWYGLMYLVAFVVTYLLFTWQLQGARKFAPQKDVVLDMFFWAIVGLLVGARAFAVTIYDPSGYYLHHPLQIILPFAVVDGRLRLTGIAGHVLPRRPGGRDHRHRHLHEGEEARHPGLGRHARGRDPARLHLRAAGQLHQRRALRQDHHGSLGHGVPEAESFPGEPAVGEGTSPPPSASPCRRRAR